MDRLTVDTDALRDLLENRSRGADVMHEIWRLVDEERAKWVVTRVIDFDIPDGKLRERLKELPILAIGQVGKVARVGEWILGEDVLGGDAFLRLQDEIVNEWKPGQKPLPGREDFDNIHTHWALGRDYFLTWDKGILGLASKFAKLGIKVMTPQQYIDARAPRVSRSSPASP